jgi:hypothetical protein
MVHRAQELIQHAELVATVTAEATKVKEHQCRVPVSPPALN